MRIYAIWSKVPTILEKLAIKSIEKCSWNPHMYKFTKEDLFNAINSTSNTSFEKNMLLLNLNSHFKGSDKIKLDV